MSSEPGQPLAYAPFDSEAPAECPCSELTTTPVCGAQDDLPPGGDPLRGPAGPPAWLAPVPWSSTANYVNEPPASAVYFGGSSYVALKDNIGVQPGTDPTTWAVIAAAGQAGPPGSEYVHTQSAPALTWTVNHNLGYFPDVALMDTGGEEYDAEVLNITVNQLQVFHDIPTAGTARCT